MLRLLCKNPRRTLRVMTNEVGTGTAAKNYIGNKRQLGLLMTIGDVNDGRRERKEAQRDREQRITQDQ